MQILHLCARTVTFYLLHFVVMARIYAGTISNYRLWSTTVMSIHITINNHPAEPLSRSRDGNDQNLGGDGDDPEVLDVVLGRGRGRPSNRPKGKDFDDASIMWADGWSVATARAIHGGGCQSVTDTDASAVCQPAGRLCPSLAALRNNYNNITNYLRRLFNGEMYVIIYY